jgi:hypothetical protein
MRDVLTMVGYRGDSLFIAENAAVEFATGAREAAVLSRTVPANVYDSRGNFGRQVRLQYPLGRRREGSRAIEIWSRKEHGLQGVTSDGSFIVRGAGWPALTGSAGTLWVREPFLRVSSDGGATDTVVQFPVRDLEEDPGLDRGYRTPHFARSAPVAAVGGKRVFMGNADQFEIVVFDVSRAAGALALPERLIRLTAPNRPVDQSVLDSYMALRLSQAQNAADSNAVRQDTKTLIARRSLPAYEELRADALGNIWAAHTRLRTMAGVPEDRSEERVWTVFDSSGALVGEATTPPGLGLAQIGADWLIGVWKDGDGVEYVRLYSIRKGG